ncbi:MAG: Lon protease family protein [Thermoanaerobaculia bacterium]
MTTAPSSEDPRRELALAAGALRLRTDPNRFEFQTTAELADEVHVVGQTRASRAVHFGIRIRGDGFNIFALGPEEVDKRTLVGRHVEERAATEPPPPDLCYVNDFDRPFRPRALRLPPGTGRTLSHALDAALQELRPTLEAAFESEEYQSRRQAAQEEAAEAHQEAFEALRDKARERGLTLVRTPMGVVFAPVRDGEVLPPDELQKLPEEERDRLRKEGEELQKELEGILHRMPRSQREARERVRELNREVAGLAVRDLFGPLRSDYAEHEGVLAHLQAVEADVIENVRQVLGEDDGGGRPFAPTGAGGAGASPVLDRPELRRYRVHVVVDHGDSEHAPVVYEDLPNHPNLVGRIEYLPVMGALITDFNLIKPGALHRANGGYLVLDAQRLLTQPFAWEGLKRALQAGEVRIESPREALGLVSTVSLDPEPVPLEVKVVLLGNPLVYYLLSAHDPDFGDLFKVQADFDDRMERSADAEVLYGRLVAGLAERHELRPFDRGAVARVIDRSARLSGDAERLRVADRAVAELVREADFWAGEDARDVVTAEDVDRAVQEWVYRSSRVRDRIQEQIERETLFIATDGSRVGQVNGLSVLQLGEFAFGKPSRITARVRLGKGEVVDIEREVELSGPIHSKGVLILTGFLGARYATEQPLALAASLVFEQSYGGIEGDSASCAELYALLSAIGEVPLDQSLAVTGSVNQHGEVQPIGGVNEKIEGFFDVCRARGLTGRQGVLIPRANVKHLMLRSDVVDAVAGGRFHVWAVETVDQGMEILTGLSMGAADGAGKYPEGTVNRRVADRLAAYAQKAREWGTGRGVPGALPGPRPEDE